MFNSLNFPNGSTIVPAQRNIGSIPCHEKSSNQDSCDYNTKPSQSWSENSSTTSRSSLERSILLHTKVIPIIGSLISAAVMPCKTDLRTTNSEDPFLLQNSLLITPIKLQSPLRFPPPTRTQTRGLRPLRPSAPETRRATTGQTIRYGHTWYRRRRKGKTLGCGEQGYSVGFLQEEVSCSDDEIGHGRSSQCCDTIYRLVFLEEVLFCESSTLISIEQGHVRCGTDVVTDPAFLVTRNMEDFVTWVDSSKIKRNILKYRDKLDDFDLL
jgi:hypothetical protein